MWIEDIVNYLESNSLGTCGVDLFWGVLPDMPKFCGAVLPAPGGSAEEAFGSTGIWLSKPRAQFVWRAGAPDQVQGAFMKAQLAFEAMYAIGHAVTVGSTHILNVSAQSPGVVEMTESGLPVVGFTFNLEIEQ